MKVNNRKRNDKVKPRFGSPGYYYLKFKKKKREHGH